MSSGEGTEALERYQVSGSDQAVRLTGISDVLNERKKQTTYAYGLHASEGKGYRSSGGRRHVRWLQTLRCLKLYKEGRHGCPWAFV